MKASKFFLSTFIAAAAMTSTAWAEGVTYDVTTDGSYTTIQSAADVATSGDTINLNAGNTALSGSVNILKNLTLTGTAVIDWSAGHFFIGRGTTNAADATLTISNANLSAKDAPSSSGRGFHISNEQKGKSEKKNGTLNILNNSNVVTDYMINKNVVNVDGSYLEVKNGFHVAGRGASETVDGLDHTAYLNISNSGYVKVVNENGMGIGTYDGSEGKGILSVSSNATFESEGYLNVREKGVVKLDSGNLIIASYLKNSGTITVGDSSVLTANVITGSGDVVLAGRISVVDGLSAGDLTVYAGAELNIGAEGVSVAAVAADRALSFETLTIVADGLKAGELDLTTILASGSTGNDEFAAQAAAAAETGSLFLQNTAGVAYTYTVSEDGKISVIPEPSAFGLLAGLGALALVVARRRRK